MRRTDYCEVCGELREIVSRGLCARCLMRRRRGTEDISPDTSEDCPDAAMAEELIQHGYRAVAKKYHPDHGGSNRQMQRVNAVVEWLRKIIRPS